MRLDESEAVSDCRVFTSGHSSTYTESKDGLRPNLTLYELGKSSAAYAQTLTDGVAGSAVIQISAEEVRVFRRLGPSAVAGVGDYV